MSKVKAARCPKCGSSIVMLDLTIMRVVVEPTGPDNSPKGYEICEPRNVLPLGFECRDPKCNFKTLDFKTTITEIEK